MMCVGLNFHHRYTTLAHWCNDISALIRDLLWKLCRPILSSVIIILPCFNYEYYWGLESRNLRLGLLLAQSVCYVVGIKVYTPDYTQSVDYMMQSQVATSNSIQYYLANTSQRRSWSHLHCTTRPDRYGLACCDSSPQRSVKQITWHDTAIMKYSAKLVYVLVSTVFCIRSWGYASVLSLLAHLFYLPAGLLSYVKNYC